MEAGLNETIRIAQIALSLYLSLLFAFCSVSCYLEKEANGFFEVTVKCCHHSKVHM